MISDALFSSLDKISMALWVLTYVLALIGTFRYKFPIISPYTPLIIAPVEIAIFFAFVIAWKSGFSYFSIMYALWSIFEIIYIFVMFKRKYIPLKALPAYIIFSLAFTAALYYLITYKDMMLIFTYANTIVGEIIWLHHLTKKDYPLNPYALSSFLVKLAADFIYAIIYLGMGGALANAMCILLPIIDLIFIAVYLEKCSIKSRRK